MADDNPRGANWGHHCTRLEAMEIDGTRPETQCNTSDKYRRADRDKAVCCSTVFVVYLSAVVCLETVFLCTVVYLEATRGRNLGHGHPNLPPLTRVGSQQKNVKRVLPYLMQNNESIENYFHEIRCILSNSRIFPSVNLCSLIYTVLYRRRAIFGSGCN